MLQPTLADDLHARIGELGRFGSARGGAAVQEGEVGAGEEVREVGGGEDQAAVELVHDPNLGGACDIGKAGTRSVKSLQTGSSMLRRSGSVVQSSSGCFPRSDRIIQPTRVLPRLCLGHHSEEFFDHFSGHRVFVFRRICRFDVVSDELDLVIQVCQLLKGW